MVQKDYAACMNIVDAKRALSMRKKYGHMKASKAVLPLTITLLTIFIVFFSFIKHNSPHNTMLLPESSNYQKNRIPPKPEERWRYIKELENSQVSIHMPTIRIMVK